MVDPTVGPWRSHTQRSTWDWLTGPNLGIRLEQQELEAAHHGVEFRYPFLDHQLARFVLSLPYERRLPGGRMKRILRDAMADRLPPCIARRKGVTTFEPVLRESLRRNLATLHCLFATDRTWASAPYVDRSAARGLFERLDLASPGHAACGGWAIVWNIAVLELWLRALG